MDALPVWSENCHKPEDTCRVEPIIVIAKGYISTKWSCSSQLGKDLSLVKCICWTHNKVFSSC